jgi:hypothetical protein
MADKAETPGQRLDRKIEERGSKSDKARAKAREDALAEQKAVDDAIAGITRDKDGDPLPIAERQPGEG